MVMRYHWGLAAGHVYTHTMENNMPQIEASAAADGTMAGDPELNARSENSVWSTNQLEEDNDVQDLDNPELGFENREDDFLGEEYLDVDEEQGILDDELLATDNLYPFISYN